MTINEILESTRKAIRDERYAEAASLATRLIEAGEPWSISGYLYRATAYENGDSFLKMDIDKAIFDYLKLSIISPGRDVYIYLSNALMTRGGGDFDRAYGYLKEAEKFGSSPGLSLAYARYYEESNRQDLNLAYKYFMAAARAGRFLGFFGAARILRKLEKPIKAFFWDMARYLLGPFIALLIGRKAQHRF